MNQIRLAGTVLIVQTLFMMWGCGKPYELTVISLEDESGVLDALNLGACGRNSSMVRAPTLAAGDEVDLLVQAIRGVKPGDLGAPPEVVELWVDRAQD